MTNPIEQSRKDFEAEAIKHYKPTIIEFAKYDADGRYMDSTLQQAFEFWQSATAAARAWSVTSLTLALEKAEKENEQLKTERDFKNKTDPIHRLHNLCAGLTEHKNESPFSQEEWDRVDAETARMQAEIADLKFELSQVRRLVRSTRKRKHVGPIPKAGSKA